ncbi:MAG: hypothetical protein GX442_00815 [Candidatus Riflebacteria bacterium]|nr:hypothetical protein [Candidatus Riflebacteria bacterium]
MGMFDVFTKAPCPECERLRAELKKLQNPSPAADMLSRSINGTIMTNTAAADIRQQPGAFLLTSLHPRPETDADFKTLIQGLQTYYVAVARAVSRAHGVVDRFDLFEVVNLFLGPDGPRDAFAAAREIMEAARSVCPLGVSQFLFADSFFSSVMGDPAIRMDFLVLSPVLIEIRKAVPGLLSPGHNQIVLDAGLREMAQEVFPPANLAEMVLPSGRPALRLTTPASTPPA